MKQAVQPSSNRRGDAAWPHVPASIPAGTRHARTWPKVSLVTPSFEQGAFLEETILSVLNQGYPDLEYVVFDGGSTDGSLDILKRYGDQITYWESVADNGQSQAINKGWKRATGKYIWWLNSDDMLMPGALFQSVAYLEDHPGVGFVYGDLEIIDAGGMRKGRHRYADFIYEQVLQTGQDISQAGALMRRDLLDRIGFLNEDLHFMMDLEYWHRLALDGIDIHHLAEPLALFRVYDETKTQASSARLIEERYRVARLITSHPRFHSTGDAAASVWSSTHIACARGYAKAGLFAPGLRECWRSLIRMPGRMLSAGWWYLVLLNLAGMVLGREGWLRLRRWLRSRRAGSVQTINGERMP